MVPKMVPKMVPQPLTPSFRFTTLEASNPQGTPKKLNHRRTCKRVLTKHSLSSNKQALRDLAAQSVLSLP